MRSNILALRQRVDLTKQGRAILAVAEKEKRELTEGEESAHYKTLKAIEQLEGELIAEEELLSWREAQPSVP